MLAAVPFYVPVTFAVTGFWPDPARFAALIEEVVS